MAGGSRPVWSWPKTELEPCSYIVLTAWRQQRYLPTLVLQVAGEAETRSREDVGIDGYVILASPLRKVLPINRPVPKFKADLVARTQPVICADQFALRCPSNPSPHQLAVIGVPTVVLLVRVKTRIAAGIGRSGACIPPFKSQIQSVNRG